MAKESRAQKKTVERVMHEFKHGELKNRAVAPEKCAIRDKRSRLLCARRARPSTKPGAKTNTISAVPSARSGVETLPWLRKRAASRCRTAVARAPGAGVQRPEGDGLPQRRVAARRGLNSMRKLG